MPTSKSGSSSRRSGGSTRKRGTAAASLAGVGSGHPRHRRDHPRRGAAHPPAGRRRRHDLLGAVAPGRGLRRRREPRGRRPRRGARRARSARHHPAGALPRRHRRCAGRRRRRPRAAGRPQPHPQPDVPGTDLARDRRGGRGRPARPGRFGRAGRAEPLARDDGHPERPAVRQPVGTDQDQRPGRLGHQHRLRVGRGRCHRQRLRPRSSRARPAAGQRLRHGRPRGQPDTAAGLAVRGRLLRPGCDPGGRGRPRHARGRHHRRAVEQRRPGGRGRLADQDHADQGPHPDGPDQRRPGVRRRILRRCRRGDPLGRRQRRARDQHEPRGRRVDERGEQRGRVRHRQGRRGGRRHGQRRDRQPLLPRRLPGRGRGRRRRQRGQEGVLLPDRVAHQPGRPRGGDPVHLPGRGHDDHVGHLDGHPARRRCRRVDQGGQAQRHRSRDRRHPAGHGSTAQGRRRRSGAEQRLRSRLSGRPGRPGQGPGSGHQADDHRPPADADHRLPAEDPGDQPVPTADSCGLPISSGSRAVNPARR